MNQSKIHSLLDRSLAKDDWPYLQSLIKQLNQFIAQKAKNRQYIEAQKAKQKVIEALDQIKKRNRFDADQRERRAIQQLRNKHQQQKLRLQKQYDVRRKKIQLQFSQLIQRKKDKQSLQRQKHLQQIQVALPINNSPDRQLHHLRHQQEQAAQIGDFVQAQRLKIQISNRELQLSKKYQKLRDSNIKTMMNQLQNKQNIQLLNLQARRDEKLNQNQKLKTKKYKQLNEKQERQLKQMIWVYSEQKKKIK